MTERINELIEKWREIGPIEWSESVFGWLDAQGKQILLDPWQRAALEAWWTQKERITTLAISTVKKSGKSFFNAVFTCWRWLTLPGVHLAVANDFDQAQGRQFLMIADMIQHHPFLKELCKVTKSELTFTPTGSMLRAIAADYQGAAGENFLTASHTECWCIQYESDVRLYEELTPIPGLFYGLPCVRIVDSYGGYIDDSDTWNKVIARGLEGKRQRGKWGIYQNGGLLLFHMTGTDAQKLCFRGSAQERKEYYKEQRATLRTNTFIRIHENITVKSTGNFVQYEAWEGLIDKFHKPLKPGAKHGLYCGLDLAVSPGGDNCAFIAVYYEAGKVKLALHKVWKGSERIKKLSLTDTVFPFIVKLSQEYSIQGIYYDSWQALALTEMLQRQGIRCIPVPQTHKSRGALDTRLFEMISNGELILYDDPDIRSATSGADCKELPNGQLFLRKSGGRSKIDLLVALSNCAGNCMESEGFSNKVEYMADPFVDRPDSGSEGYTFNPDIGWVHGWETTPHRPGVTYKNCKNRNKGCYACEREAKAAGIFEQQLAEARAHGYGNPNHLPMTEDEAYQKTAENTGILYQYQQIKKESENEQKFLSKFWRHVDQQTRKN